MARSALSCITDSSRMRYVSFEPITRDRRIVKIRHGSLQYRNMLLVNITVIGDTCYATFSKLLQQTDQPSGDKDAQWSIWQSLLSHHVGEVFDDFHVLNGNKPVTHVCSLFINIIDSLQTVPQTKRRG